LKPNPKKTKPILLKILEEVVVDEVKTQTDETNKVIQDKKKYKRLHKLKEEIITIVRPETRNRRFWYFLSLFKGLAALQTPIAVFCEKIEAFSIS